MCDIVVYTANTLKENRGSVHNSTNQSLTRMEPFINALGNGALLSATHAGHVPIETQINPALKIRGKLNYETR